MADTAIITAVILALNEGLKRLGLPSKWCIVTSWAFGVLTSTVNAITGHQNIYPAILNGFLVGSAASGLYDAGRIGLDKIKGASNGQESTKK